MADNEHEPPDVQRVRPTVKRRRVRFADEPAQWASGKWSTAELETLRGAVERAAQARGVPPAELLSGAWTDLTHVWRAALPHRRPKSVHWRAQLLVHLVARRDPRLHLAAQMRLIGDVLATGARAESDVRWASIVWTGLAEAKGLPGQARAQWAALKKRHGPVGAAGGGLRATLAALRAVVKQEFDAALLADTSEWCDDGDAADGGGGADAADGDGSDNGDDGSDGGGGGAAADGHNRSDDGGSDNGGVDETGDGSDDGAGAAAAVRDAGARDAAARDAAARYAAAGRDKARHFLDAAVAAARYAAAGRDNAKRFLAAAVGAKARRFGCESVCRENDGCKGGGRTGGGRCIGFGWRGDDRRAANLRDRAGRLRP